MTLALGHKSVTECRRWVSSHEFTQWMAYDRLEPIGNDLKILDLHFGQLLSLTANIHSDPKKGKTMKPEDFMLLPAESEDEEPDDQRVTDSSEMYSIFRSFAVNKGK